MADILQIGPFAVRTVWLVLALSAAMGYIFMFSRWKRSDFRDRPALDPLANAALILMAVWKLSPLITSPFLLKQNPLVWLTFPGNDGGWGIGIAAASLYLYVRWKKIGVPWQAAGDLLAGGFAAAVFAHSLLGWQYGWPTSLPWAISGENPEFKYHPVNLYRLLVVFPMLVWLWRNGRSIGSGKPLSHTLTFCGTGLLAVSLFESQSVYVLGLSAEQASYLSMVLAGLGFSVIFRRGTGNIHSTK